MKNSKIQLTLIAVAALGSIAQAETFSITSQFTPLENLSAKDRASVQWQVENEHPWKQFNWEKSILGVNENGKIEVRDKNSLKLQAVIEPTCAGADL